MAATLWRVVADEQEQDAYLARVEELGDRLRQLRVDYCEAYESQVRQLVAEIEEAPAHGLFKQTAIDRTGFNDATIRTWAWKISDKLDLSPPGPGGKQPTSRPVTRRG